MSDAAELRRLERENRRLREELIGQQMREQGTILKWRAKNEALAQELQLAQVGLTSGCGCPIGVCQRERRQDGSSCWLQWAESHLARRMADIRISELQRHAVHPSRFAQARAEGKTVPRLQDPAPDDGVEGGGRAVVPRDA